MKELGEIVIVPPVSAEPNSTMIKLAQLKPIEPS